MAALITLLTLCIHGYRLALAPDVFSDEGLYLLVGTNLANGLGLVGDQGLFFWHPPLYLLVEGAFIKLMGIGSASPLDVLFQVRWLNVVFSALTAGLLVLFGRRLHSLRAGVVIAALFIMDPYVQRINRRSMLETLAMLLALLAVYLYFTEAPRPSRWRVWAAGVTFGLATLTKEIMLLELGTVLLYVLWLRRQQLRDALMVCALAVGTYAIYPAWAFAIGAGDMYMEYKVYGVLRFVAWFNGVGRTMAPDTTAPAVSAPPLLDNLLVVLGPYATSYAFLALGAVATPFLFWVGFRTRRAPVAYVAAWGAVSYAVIGFGVGIGKISDQFFYFLIVPAIVVLGYVLNALVPTLATLARSRTVDQRTRRMAKLARVSLAGTVTLFLAVVAYNAFQWETHYALGRDDSYAQVYRYVTANVPPGSTLVVGSDVSNFFLRPTYDIQFMRDSQSVLDHDAQYFIFSSKEPWGNYNFVSRGFYNWVMANTTPLLQVDGATYWTMGVYYRDDTALAKAP